MSEAARRRGVFTPARSQPGAQGESSPGRKDTGVKIKEPEAAQKRQAIAAYIKANPTVSDYRVGKQLGASQNTVADVRDGQDFQSENNDHSPIERAKAGGGRGNSPSRVCRTGLLLT